MSDNVESNMLRQYLRKVLENTFQVDQNDMSEYLNHIEQQLRDLNLFTQFNQTLTDEKKTELSEKVEPIIIKYRRMKEESISKQKQNANRIQTFDKCPETEKLKSIERNINITVNGNILIHQ